MKFKGRKKAGTILVKKIEENKKSKDKIYENLLLSNAYFVPRSLVKIFISATFLYVLYSYFFSSATFLNFWDALYHFSPIIVLIILTKAGFKHERFEGITLLLMSFIFLNLYNLIVSIVLFAVLFSIAIMFIVDNYKYDHRKKSIYQPEYRRDYA